jgi:hypothetical protein
LPQTNFKFRGQKTRAPSYSFEPGISDSSQRSAENNFRRTDRQQVFVFQSRFICREAEDKISGAKKHARVFFYYFRCGFTPENHAFFEYD